MITRGVRNFPRPFDPYLSSLPAMPGLLRGSPSPASVDQGHLVVEGPIVIDVTDPQDAPGEQVNDSRDPFPHVHPVDTQEPQEGEQDPGHVVVQPSRAESQVGLPVHGRDQEEVHDPPDQEKTQGEEPDGPGYGFAVVEPVRSRKAEDPAPISSICTVFAESEVISLKAKGRSKEDIISGIHEAIGRRMHSMINHVGMVSPAVISGGVAKNVGVVRVLERLLKTEIIIPQEPQIVGALGAALFALEELHEKKR